MPNYPFPTFSIITITFNAEAYIENTIRSVISQKGNYPPIEYIIIDGASKDKTLDILSKYRDNITKMVSEPDKGLYDAMNKGISLATGDYLCFLNAGDIFHEPDTLKKIADSITSDELPDIIYGETAIVNGKGEFLHMRRLQAPETLTWKSFKNGMLVCHQAFLAKRSIAEPYNLSYRFSSDFDWCIRMLKKADTTYNTHLILIDYLEEGLTTKNRYPSLLERFHIMSHYYGMLSTIAHHIWFVLRLLIKH